MPEEQSAIKLNASKVFKENNKYGIQPISAQTFSPALILQVMATHLFLEQG